MSSAPTSTQIRDLCLQLVQLILAESQPAQTGAAASDGEGAEPTAPPQAAEAPPGPAGLPALAEEAAGPAEPPPAAAPAPEAGWELAGDPGRDLRVYAFWGTPRARATGRGPGVYVGEHPHSWQAVLDNIEEGQYAGSGAALRRYSSVPEALASWRTGAPRRLASRLPREPAVFQCP